MLKPHHKQADLLMDIAARYRGQRSVNRRYCPPLTAYNILLKRGLVAVDRTGLPNCRTTFVKLTEDGLAQVKGLLRHYDVRLAPEIVERLPA